MDSSNFPASIPDPVHESSYFQRTDTKNSSPRISQDFKESDASDWGYQVKLEHDSNFDLSQIQRQPQQNITEAMHVPKDYIRSIKTLDSFLKSKLIYNKNTQTLDYKFSPHPGSKISINTFSKYLREIIPRYQEYISLAKYASSSNTKQRAKKTDETPLKHYQPSSTAAIPLVGSEPSPVYFQEHFTLISSPEILEFEELEHPLEEQEQEKVQEILERLQFFSDTLDRQLFKQVNQHKIQIDHAIAAVNDLKITIKKSVDATAQLRILTSTTVKNIQEGALNVRNIYFSKQNAENIFQILQNMAQIRRAPDDIELLLQTSDYKNAIETIETMKALLNDPELTKLKALQPSRERLGNVADRIDEKLTQSFRNLVSSLNGISDEELDEKAFELRAIVEIQFRLGRMSKLFDAIAEETRIEVDGTVQIANNRAKGFVSASQVESSINTIFAEIQRSTSLVGFVFTHLKSVSSGIDSYENQFNKISQRAEVFCAEIQEIGAHLVSRHLENLSIFLDPEQKENEISTMYRFCDILQRARNLAAQLEQTLGIKKGRTKSLRGIVNERASSYVSAMHSRYSEGISNCLLQEKWNSVSVEYEIQHLLNRLRNASLNVEDAKRKFAQDSNNGETYDPFQNDGENEFSILLLTRKSLKLSEEDLDRKIDQLFVGKESFKVVESTLVLLRCIFLYVECTVSLDFGVQGDICRRLYEIIRVFNEITHKMILGAGAMRSAGLRSITARHLATASRTIALLNEVLHFVNNCLLKSIPPNQKVLIEDIKSKLGQDLLQHGEALRKKITSVMLERINFHKTGLAQLPWDSESALRSEEYPSKSITGLIKETSVLQRILLEYIPREKVLPFFELISKDIGDEICSVYERVFKDEDYIIVRIGADVDFLYLKFKLMGALVGVNSNEPLERLHEKFGSKAFMKNKEKAAEGKGGIKTVSEEEQHEDQKHQPEGDREANTVKEQGDSVKTQASDEKTVKDEEKANAADEIIDINNEREQNEEEKQEFTENQDQGKEVKEGQSQQEDPKDTEKQDQQENQEVEEEQVVKSKIDSLAEELLLELGPDSGDDEKHVNRQPKQAKSKKPKRIDKLDVLPEL